MKKYIELKMDGHTMRGMENCLNNERCVLMFHGFTGNKLETNRIFYNIDKLVEMEGISSLRFDWFGHGESDLNLSDINIDILLKQAAIIFDYARRNYQEVYLIGFSMGGALAINSLKYKPKKLILISPATNMEEITKTIFNTYDKINDKLVDLNGTSFSIDFVESCKKLEYKNNLSKYQEPVLLIHGTEDLAVPISYSIALKDYLNMGEFIKIEGAGHGYGKLKFMDNIFKLIIDYIK